MGLSFERPQAYWGLVGVHLGFQPDHDFVIDYERNPGFIPELESTSGRTAVEYHISINMEHVLEEVFAEYEGD